MRSNSCRFTADLRIFFFLKAQGRDRDEYPAHQTGAHIKQNGWGG
jgi:hypothetical protein